MGGRHTPPCIHGGHKTACKNSLSFQHFSPGDPTQGIRLGRRHLYPLNILTCPSTMFSKRKINRVQTFSGVIRTLDWVPNIPVL